MVSLQQQQFKTAARTENIFQLIEKNYEWNFEKW